MFFQDENRGSSDREVETVDDPNKYESFSDYIEKELLPVALGYVNYNEFFDYTLKELHIIIKAKQQKQLSDMKQLASIMYCSDINSTRLISMLFSEKDNDMPMFFEAYPSVFTQQEINEMKQEIAIKQSKILAEQFKAFMQQDKIQKKIKKSQEEE